MACSGFRIHLLKYCTGAIPDIDDICIEYFIAITGYNNDYARPLSIDSSMMNVLTQMATNFKAILQLDFDNIY